MYTPVGHPDMNPRAFEFTFRADQISLDDAKKYVSDLFVHLNWYCRPQITYAKTCNIRIDKVNVLMHVVSLNREFYVYDYARRIIGTFVEMHEETNFNGLSVNYKYNSHIETYSDEDYIELMQTYKQNIPVVLVKNK